MSNEKEVVKKEVDSSNGNSPAEMIRMAVSGGADLEKLGKLLDLQERWEANEARKAYHRAMSEFKANPIEILKDKKVGYESKTGGRVGYSHASLANVVRKITKELSKYGLSASWCTAQNGQISVTCKITHVMGHSEETTLSAPSDTSGSKNLIQAIGSTITYLERYTLLASLGLATADQDDDAISVEEFIDETQLKTITDLIKSLKVDDGKFLAFLEIETLNKMPKRKFQTAMEALKAKQAKAKTEAKNANA